MIKLITMMVCVLTVFLSSAYAQETVTTVKQTDYVVTQPVPVVPRVEFEARYWMPQLDGNVFVTDNSQSTDVDFDSDLGIDDDHGLPGGRFIVHTGPYSQLRASYTYLHYKGDNNLSRNITFDGQTYPATTHVESDLRVHYFSLGWLWNFIHTDNDKFQAGIILDLKGISARGALDAPGLGFSNRQSFTGGAPTPGVSVAYNVIPSLGLFAEITGLPAGGYGHFLDAEGGIKWNITHNVAISGGYRVVDIKVDYKDDSGSLNLKGPFAAVTLKF